MNYSKYIASFAVFLMGLLISFGLSNGSRTEMQEAAVQNAFNMRATVAGSYKSLSAEIDMGLRQSGVAPTWRDYALKKVETLKKQGLDAKKVAELRAKIASSRSAEKRAAKPMRGIQRPVHLLHCPSLPMHLPILKRLRRSTPSAGLAEDPPGGATSG